MASSRAHHLSQLKLFSGTHAQSPRSLIGRGLATLSEQLRQSTVFDSNLATKFEPGRYFEEKFGWTPWSGTADEPGQQQILDAYILALRQQLEKRDFDAGKLERGELRYWQPGETIRYILRIEAGHTTGKTKLAAGIVSHFFDHFAPSITYTYAPSWLQIKDLLWKEIGTDREGREDLPGKLLDNCEIKYRHNHFAKGRATDNAGGKGTERIHGQHGQYLLFVIDEAEGVADFVFDAIGSMASGGIVIVLMLANPRTRTSRFHKMGSKASVRNFRMSCLSHPNVIQNREIVPGAVKREYVLSMVEDHARVARQHNPDDFTFELPWEPGTIYEPDAEMMFRVLGVAPSNTSDKNLIPVGRYEAAVKRTPVDQDPHVARMGLDVARFGKDFGTLYIRWNGQVWCAGKVSKLDTVEYYQFARAQALALKERGVKDIHIRIDGGGGFGGGVVDNLVRDDELLRVFHVFQVHECQFGAAAQDKRTYYDAATEWTADVAESLKSLSILRPANELQEDLCEREYDFKNKNGFQVKKLEEKLKFRERVGRSPDDGDGFVLAVVSDFLLSDIPPVTGTDDLSRVSPWGLTLWDGDDD